MKTFSWTRFFIRLFFLTVIGVLAYQWVLKYFHENEILKEVINRLSADSRVAEVLVTGVNYDEKTKKSLTTIKFLEYDSHQKPTQPRYFTFSGNIIQFQSLVIRFSDFYVRIGDRLKGKSAFIFWKVFMLDGERTQEYEITPMMTIPSGYKIEGEDPFEAALWKNFWMYALDPTKAQGSGIKNAQIEAPGTMFVPGILYTIKIEHDGGLRIDTTPLPPILKGETIPQ